MCLISVIVPVYNAGEFLRPCLESIAAQTHRELEVLLVENASTDDSRRVCMDFCTQDPRFICLPQSQNLGIAGARGAGAAQARGDYVAFVDGDDLIHPQMLEALLGAVRASGLSLGCCRFSPFPSGTQPENGAIPAQWESMPSPRHLRALLLDQRVDYSMCNKLYAAELLHPRQFRIDVVYNEDLMTNWGLLQKASGLVFVNFVGYHYRQHHSSVTHKPMQAAFITDQAKVARRILDDSIGTPFAPVAQAFYYDKLLYLYSMILRQSNAADFEPLRLSLLKEIRGGLGRLLGLGELSARMKLAALGTVFGGQLYAQVCRRMLTDRQN